MTNIFLESGQKRRTLSSFVRTRSLMTGCFLSLLTKFSRSNRGARHVLTTLRKILCPKPVFGTTVITDRIIGRSNVAIVLSVSGVRVVFRSLSLVFASKRNPAYVLSDRWNYLYTTNIIQIAIAGTRRETILLYTLSSVYFLDPPSH